MEEKIMLNYKALEHSDDFGTEVICWVEVAGVPERFVDEAKRIDGENYSSDPFPSTSKFLAHF